MLPLSGQNVWSEPLFWMGLFFCMLPLNLLVYGWNDIADYEIDQYNPRKGNYLFGALSSQSEIEKLPYLIIAILLICLAVILPIAPSGILIWLALMIIINWLYNKRKNGLRSLPPYELMAQAGYLMIVPFSMSLNGIESLHPWLYIYLFLFAVQSHLMGEVMDIDADRKSGRKTTATKIGMMKTKKLIMLLVAIEALIMFLVFGEYIFGGFLVGVLVWLLLDAFILFKDNRYDFNQMKLFSIGSNLIAIVTMVYVYFYGDKLF